MFDVGKKVRVIRIIIKGYKKALLKRGGDPNGLEISLNSTYYGDF